MDINQALKLLDLSPSFTHEELNLQWRKLAKRYHPDLAGDGSTETFILINDTYKFLKNYRQKYPQEPDWSDFRKEYAYPYHAENVGVSEHEKTFIQVVMIFILAAVCMIFLQVTDNQMIKTYYYYASLSIITLFSKVLVLNTKGVSKI